MRERRDPQQRHRRDVLGDVVGHGEQQQRSGCRQRAPEQLPRRGGRRGGCARERGATGFERTDGRRGMPSETLPARGSAEAHKERIAQRPADRLHARWRPRLEQEGVAHECQHRREIRQREQPIRARPRPRAGEPRLYQRARRRQEEIGCADRHGEEPKNQPGRILGAGRLPARRRNDRQDGEREKHQHDVNAHLPARPEPAHHDVRIKVAREERRLEEHEARGPHGGRAAEPGKDLLRDDRLDQEQQERADEDGDGE